ncbi:MAG: DUF6062 family protein [Dehalococcoidia bacterium]|nr:DUF6062 family protein [Dehalococcoidia bacterium]
MEEAISQPTKELSFISLEDALQQSRCPICRVVREHEEGRIWILLYEQTADVPLRELFDRSLGFCQYHAYLTISIVRERELMTGSSVARMYETVVAFYRQAVQELLKTKQATRAFRHGRDPLGRLATGECLVCQARHKTLLAEVNALLRMLRYEEYRSAYAKSDGLCNPDLARAIMKASPETVQFLLEDHERRIETLEKRLVELQRKQSYDVDEAVTTEEQGSSREAVWRFTGVSWGELLTKRR